MEECDMKKYEYKFVEVPKKRGLKIKIGDTFEECRKIINSHSEQGWRLKQIVVPLNEKTGVYGAWCYQIIFEREL